MDKAYKVSPLRKVKNIDVFEKDTKYWCNVSPETMRILIDEIDQGGDFDETVMKYLAGYKDHFYCDYRADAGLLLPIDQESVVLDAGSMWGGLTIPIACHCREIYALDQTLETLELLSLRARKENINNIKLLNCSLQNLPFVDGYFDCIILNGVLEWVGMDEDVIVVDMWEKKFSGARPRTKSPRDIQQMVLKELRRVLKPDGVLYIAIENRIALKHFFGYPDPHINIPWVTILPRLIADALTKIKKGIDYRTYIYSPSQLIELLKEAGFLKFSMYALSHDYRKIVKQAPFAYYRRFGERRIPLFYESIKRRIFGKLIPSSYKYCDSLAVLCSESSIAPARILQILEKQGVIDSAANYFAAINNVRYENGTPVRIMIIDKATGRIIYYVKAARYSRRGYCNIADESGNFNYIYSKLPPELRARLIEVCYDGEADGYRLLVTKFIPKNISPENRLRRFGITSPHLKKELIKFNSNAIGFLVDFQKSLTVDHLPVTDIIRQFKEKAGELGIKERFSELFNCLYSRLSDDELNFKLPLTVQHGDFDTTNILGWPCADVILDFEELNKSGTPFLDLSNLLLNNFILFHKLKKTTTGFQPDWMEVIECGINTFSEKSRIPINIVSQFHLFGCLEHQIINYRRYRNKEAFPLYGKEAVEMILKMEFRKL
ncbi:MAG: class I SAM-dependent methyltransferase [Victivallaceae bacterium]|nr:class I SAM-dependent methyltransferase [Victivallaceae bacterium]